jgi:hypothetical protein
MSLETSLELNNKLLTQHNALLEQLITALASGQTIQQTVVTQVQEYRESVPDKSTSEGERPGLETLEPLEFSDVKDAEKDDTPDFAALRKQAEGLILQLAKGGYRAEAVAILEKQGAKKLGEVADENLADVVAQAEKALEG